MKCGNMTKEEQDSLQTWLEHYTNQFRDRDGVLHPLLELKRCHSLRVAGNARFIAAALSFPESEQRLAEGVGLVHDVGRFTQFVRYGSFRDSDTVDHGAEGRRVLEEQDPSFLPDSGDRERLFCVVEYHNRKRTDIPRRLSPEKNRFLSLIRDADKLDIMELVLRAVVNDGFQDLREMLPHIRLSRELSPGVLAEAAKKGSVSNGNLSTLADFLVMMATWCYDMNYPPTRHLAVKRGILPRIRRELPDTKPVRELFAGIEDAMMRTVEISEKKSYQAKGEIECFTDGPIYEDMRQWVDQKKPRIAAAVLRVDELYSGAEKLI